MPMNKTIFAFAHITLKITLLLSFAGVGLAKTASSSRTVKPPAQSKIDTLAEGLRLQRERLDLDRKKLEQDQEIEMQRLGIEEAKLKQEVSAAHLTAWLSIVPFLAAIGTLIYSIWSFRSQIANQTKLQNEGADLQFQMKAAEIAFSGSRTPEAVHNRAKALKALFEDRLPSGFAKNFEADAVGGNKEVPEVKQFFLGLLLKYPERSVEIANLWDALFKEEWVDRIRPLLPLGHNAMPPNLGDEGDLPFDRPQR
jgi:hypothetical protein